MTDAEKAQQHTKAQTPLGGGSHSDDWYDDNTQQQQQEMDPDNANIDDRTEIEKGNPEMQALEGMFEGLRRTVVVDQQQQQANTADPILHKGRQDEEDEGTSSVTRDAVVENMQRELNSAKLHIESLTRKLAERTQQQEEAEKEVTRLNLENYELLKYTKLWLNESDEPQPQQPPFINVEPPTICQNQPLIPVEDEHSHQNFLRPSSWQWQQQQQPPPITGQTEYAPDDDDNNNDGYDDDDDDDDEDDDDDDDEDQVVIFDTTTGNWSAATSCDVAQLQLAADVLTIAETGMMDSKKTSILVQLLRNFERTDYPTNTTQMGPQCQQISVCPQLGQFGACTVGYPLSSASANTCTCTNKQSSR
eukprot:TRINITY_DN66830_c13_g5_i1.p1 TRINITY_DN66830_c13_g5~~TRINITY_DN66830_c13_g5_i1.p1  ORF type:complete len:388 (-),score=84.58 TRINITY_DN66830_c13_g5_i1:529-1614(-)